MEAFMIPSDQMLTRARIVALVKCPTCGAKRGMECKPLMPGPGGAIVRLESHEARRVEARALVRELRLGPVRPS